MFCSASARDAGGGIAHTTWTPLDETGLLMWLVASDLVCTHVGSPCTDGDTVDYWFDSSAQGADLSHVSFDDPTFRANGWKTGVPAVEFTGVNQGLGSSSNALFLHLSGTNRPLTALFAISVDGFASTQGIFTVRDSATSAGFFFELLSSQRARFTVIDGSGGAAVQSGALKLSTGHNRIGFSYTGTALTSWVNGNRDLAAAAAVVGLHTFDNGGVGTTNVAVPNALDGMIQEAAFFNAACDDAFYHRWRAYSIQNNGY